MRQQNRMNKPEQKFDDNRNFEFLQTLKRFSDDKLYYQYLQHRDSVQRLKSMNDSMEAKKQLLSSMKLKTVMLSLELEFRGIDH